MSSSNKKTKVRKIERSFEYWIYFRDEVIDHGYEKNDLPFFDPTLKENPSVKWRSYTIQHSKSRQKMRVVVNGPDLEQPRYIVADMSKYWDDPDIDPESTKPIGDRVEFLTEDSPHRTPMGLDDVNIRRSQHLTDEELRDLALDYVKYLKARRQAEIATIRGRARWEGGQGTGALISSVLDPLFAFLSYVLQFASSVFLGCITIITHSLDGSTVLGSAVFNFLFGTLNVVGMIFKVFLEIGLRIIMLIPQTLLSTLGIVVNLFVNLGHALSQVIVGVASAFAMIYEAFAYTGGCFGRILQLIFTGFILIFLFALLV